MKTKIITARMEEEVFYQINYLKDHLGMPSTTSVLKEAVHKFYDDFKQKETHKSPYELLEELNLVGCVKGKKNLSKDYKKELSQSLTKKHNKSKKKPSC